MKRNKQSAKDKRTNKLNNKKREKMEIAPVAMSQSQRFPAKGARRSWRFTNSELVGTISGTIGFAAIRYRLNPGLPSSFPWLSGEADKWEHYRFHRLRYRYIPRCPTSTTGSVIISPEYNPRDYPPATELEAADTYGAVEGACWAPITCELDPASMCPFGPRKLIRSSAVAGDMNLYDSGDVYVCTTGASEGGVAYGKIWVDYDVEFFVPQNSPPDDEHSSNTTILRRISAQAFADSVPTEVAITSPTAGLNPLGITAVSGSSVITLPAGCYLVQLSMCLVAADATTQFMATLESNVDYGAWVSQQVVASNTYLSAGGISPIVNFNVSMLFTIPEPSADLRFRVTAFNTAVNSNPSGQPTSILISVA